MGFVRFHFELFNAAGERVMTLVTSLMLGRREQAASGRIMKFWEDIAVGERAEVGRYTFTAENIKAFAQRFDPQPFHLDEAEAARSHFGALCASGWHTASVWMRLMVEYQNREDAATRARGEAVATLGPSPGFRELKWLKPVYVGDTVTYSTEIIDKRAFQQPARLGSNVDPQQRREPEGRAGDLLHQYGLRRAAQERDMSAISEAAPNTPAVASAAEERRALGVACGAHALHDGYTDLIYVMLPLWQAEFGIGYAALGLLRTCFSGTMAGFQIPSALLAERLGLPLVLAVGTALSGIGYLIAGASIGFWTLVIALLIGGLGSSTQHPLASALVARAFAGSRSMKALGTYNFAGDIGKMSVPAAASLMLVLLPWQPVLAHPRARRPRGGGGDLLAGAAPAGRGPRAGQRREEGGARPAAAAASAFRCCCRSA